MTRPAVDRESWRSSGVVTLRGASHLAPKSMLDAILSLLRNAGAFLAASFLVCSSINARLPSAFVFGLTQKLEYLAAHPEIDTLFIGSSRVLHAFDPRQFDREMAERGNPTHSFNFGIDGMRPPESYYVLREVLKQRPHFRRVFVELVDIFPKVNPANLGSARYHHWHDWRHTRLVLRQVFATRELLSDKVEQTLVHLLCFVVRTSNLGRGPEIIGALLRGPGKLKPLPNPWEETAGFAPQLTPKLSGEAREKFEQAVANLQASELGKVPMPALCAEAIRGVIADIRAAGAEPIFVLSPTVARGENFTDFAAAGIDAPLIAFNDPRTHPGIFRAGNHCDVEHLNAAGAAEYTHAFAEEFAKLR